MTKTELGKAIGRTGYFTLAFGAIVGSGWVVVLGEWFNRAAPGGTMLGLLAGAAIMMAIGTCYAELATRLPRAGGEFLYTLESFGPLPAFLIGWFIALNAIAVAAFEAIALAWFLMTLFPQLDSGLAWSAFARPVQGEAVIIGTAGAIAVAALHYSGARAAVAFQNYVTISFIAVMVVLIATGVLAGHPGNLLPAFTPTGNGSWLTGAVWIFATSAFFLNGFQAAIHAFEERRPEVSARDAVLAMLLAIGAAGLFYCSLIIATGFAAPWRELVGSDLPAVAAFGKLPFGNVFATLVLVAAAASLAKTWTAVTLIASRLIFAQARLGYLPSALARVHAQRQVPTVAILFVMCCTLVGILLGKSAVLAIVNMSAICVALSFVVCIACLLRQRRVCSATPTFQVPFGKSLIWIALCGSSVMAVAGILEPLRRTPKGMPLEWTLILGWGALGFTAWVIARRLNVRQRVRVGQG
jgi:APA family basic amino acid/polyamine antiporter